MNFNVLKNIFHKYFKLIILSSVSLFLIIGVTSVYSGSAKKNPYEETVKKLHAMETSNILPIEKEITDCQIKNGNFSNLDGKNLDENEIKKLREQILQNKNLLSDIQIKKAFSGSCIIGDSVIEAIVGYDILSSDVAVAKLGLSVIEANEQIDTAISLAPKKIFMCFGLNDMENYEDNIQSFIEDYAKQIKKIQKALPKTKIFICSIIPPSKDVQNSNKTLSKVYDYNKALKSFCNNYGLTYIDSEFITESNPDLFDTDGEHPLPNYYKYWLTYIARIGGLS